jgi:predicted Zn-dependent protease
MKREEFEQLAARVCSPASGTERVLLKLQAESSDFIRFNHGKVLQPAQVAQIYGTLAVVRGQSRIEATVSLSGDVGRDAQTLLAERARLAAQLDDVPADPHLLLPDTVTDTVREDHGKLPSSAELIDAVTTQASGSDWVGFYAGGVVQHAFADSRGQRNWHSVENFQCDWSVYQHADKAVKASYTGTHWETHVFAERISDSIARSQLLRRAARKLVPDAYAVYLSPVAMADILGLLAWGGFGAKGVKTGVSSLIKLHRDEARLHETVHLSEQTRASAVPQFQDEGFVKPDKVELVSGGRAVGALVSPRSALEFGLISTASAPEESPDALSLLPGALAPAEVLRQLDRGVWISNLHYLNYSDRQTCRITGMTRFACWWVEHGELVAPIDVMRFDDSVLRMLGVGLSHLTSQAETIADARTYGARQLGSVTTPGAIIQEFRLTL